MIDITNTTTGRFAYITKKRGVSNRYSVTLGETCPEGVRVLVPWSRIKEVMSVPPSRGERLSLDEARCCVDLWVGNP